ncbi:MAG: RraA family protein [Acidobacteriota bacterium]
MKSQRILSLPAALLLLTSANAQMETFSREDLLRFTPLNPYERFEDSRPRVPDELLERLKLVTVEEAWGVLRGEGYNNQWEGGWKIIHPENKLVGRVLTAQFMPLRPDVNSVLDREAEHQNLARSQNLRVIDRLGQDDVVVVDLFGKIDGGTFVGGNLATSVFARTRTGMVLDGSIRDLEEVYPISDLVAYVRDFHPSAIANVMLTGVNVPVRIGEVTVMPGDIVLGDRGGVIFIPPHLVEKVIESSEKVRLKDEFTKKMMLEGKYHPSEIYPQMSEEVKKEFEEWLKEKKGNN